MALVHIYEERQAKRPITEEISLQAEKSKIDSFRALRDRILIAEEIETANSLIDWDTAVTNYLNTLDGKKFAERFSSINATLVHMARKTDLKPSLLMRWRMWRGQRNLVKEYKKFKESQ